MGQQRAVLVCGGRQYSDKERLFAVLDAAHAAQAITEIIHGAAVGADSMAGEWAQARGVPVRAFPADWDTHGRKAGPLRNQQMLVEGRPDEVIAFPGGRGTANMTGQARELGVRVTIVSPNAADQ